MPPSIDIDKEQVKMLVLSIGVREAARKMGLSEDTVKSWSLRGKWLDGCKPTAPMHPLPKSMQKIPAPVAPKPSEILSNTLLEDGKSTRIAGMKYAKKVTEYAVKMAENDPESALAAASDVKAAIQVGAIAGDWQQSPQGNGGVTVVVGLQVVGRPDQFEAMDEGTTHDLPE